METGVAFGVLVGWKERVGGWLELELDVDGLTRERMMGWIVEEDVFGSGLGSEINAVMMARPRVGEVPPAIAMFLTRGLGPLDAVGVSTESDMAHCLR